MGKDKVKDKTPQRLLLRQLTSGLTIQAAAGQFKWQQLSVADDASAVFAQCPDAVGLPSLWLWTATSSSSDSDGKVSVLVASLFLSIPALPPVPSQPLHICMGRQHC